MCRISATIFAGADAHGIPELYTADCQLIISGGSAPESLDTTPPVGSPSVFSSFRTPDRTNTNGQRLRSRILSFLFRAEVVSIIIGVATFLLYLSTVSPSWGFVDGGELSAVASRLGVCHPTGYPTTILLGHLAVLLSPLRDVVTLNVFAALCTALSVSVLFYLSLDVILRVNRSEPGDSYPYSSIGVAAVASLLTGTGVVWWSQATRFEVYALHLLVTLVAARLFLRYVASEAAGDRKGFTRQGTRFAVALGLAFTTHLTAVFWLPAIAVYYFGTVGINRAAFARLRYLLPGFVLGLAPYLYLPIAAATDPVLNWGDPDSPSRFAAHVSGAIFSDKMFGGWDAFTQQIGWFFSALPADFMWGGVLFSIAGIVTLFRSHRPVAVWTLLVFGVTVILSGNYTILDVEPYFLPAIAIAGVWCAVGLDEVRRRVGAAEAISIGLILMLVNVRLNYDDVNRSGDRYSEEMTLNVLNSLPKDAVILSDDWDFWVSGSLYAQHAEGVRTDVDVIYFTLLQFDWYRRDLMRREPELMAGLERIDEAYAAEMESFTSGEREEAALGRYLWMTVNGIVENAIRNRPVFVTGGIPPGIGAAYERVPNYLALRLVEPGRYVEQEFPNYRFNPSVVRVDPYIAMIHELYGRSYIARGIYEEQHGHINVARRYYRAAFAFDPNYLTSDVPDFPLNGEEQIGATDSYFEEMRGRIENYER